MVSAWFGKEMSHPREPKRFIRWAEKIGPRPRVPRSPALRASPFASGSKASSNWMVRRLARMSVPAC